MVLASSVRGSFFRGASSVENASNQRVWECVKSKLKVARFPTFCFHGVWLYFDGLIPLSFHEIVQLFSLPHGWIHFKSFGSVLNEGMMQFLGHWRWAIAHHSPHDSSCWTLIYGTRQVMVSVWSNLRKLSRLYADVNFLRVLGNPSVEITHPALFAYLSSEMTIICRKLIYLDFCLTIRDTSWLFKLLGWRYVVDSAGQQWPPHAYQGGKKLFCKFPPKRRRSGKLPNKSAPLKKCEVSPCLPCHTLTAAESDKLAKLICPQVRVDSTARVVCSTTNPFSVSFDKPWLINERPNRVSNFANWLCIKSRKLLAVWTTRWALLQLNRDAKVPRDE